MIEKYDFGQIVIDGKKYNKDLMVFPDRIKVGWWRREGHRVHIEDIAEILKEKPEVLIIGKGYYGLMEVTLETEKRIRSEGIELIAEKTSKACEIFNAISKSRRVVAALHLTC